MDLTQCCLEHDVRFWTREGPDGQTVDFVGSNVEMLRCFVEADPVIGGLAAAVAAVGIFTGGLVFWRRGRRGARADIPPGTGAA